MPLREHRRPQELCDLVKKLLVRKPAYRLGQGAGGATAIKRHAWFAGFDWAAFGKKKLKAPYVPVVRVCAAAAGVQQRLVHACMFVYGLACAPFDLWRGGGINAEAGVARRAQVKSSADASNFNAAVDDNAAGGAYRSKPYVSHGDFKEF